MEIIYFVVRLLFFMFTLGVTFHLYHLTMDARKDQLSVQYVKRFLPHLYKREYEIVSNDTIRNMWYRFLVSLLMLSIAIFMFMSPTPRPMWQSILLSVILILVPLVMLINARDEVQSKESLRVWFRNKKRELESTNGER